MNLAVAVRIPAPPADRIGIALGTLGKFRVVEWMDDVQGFEVCEVGRNIRGNEPFLMMHVVWRYETGAEEWYVDAERVCGSSRL